MIGLFCRISSLLYGSFAKETYNFKKPTNRTSYSCELMCSGVNKLMCSGVNKSCECVVNFLHDMGLDAVWCSVVQCGAAWFSVVQ